MLFNSLTFLAFFALVLAVYHLPLPWRGRKAWLLVASYAFYAAWNPPFVLLLWISTAIDFVAARRIANPRAGRRRWLCASLLANLGMLGFFKYGDFLLANTRAALAMIGIDYRPPDWDIVLPVGISFYTFQTLSYTIDVFRRRRGPTRDPLDFALYVTFFPQLVAGPIVRAGQLLPQFAAERRADAGQLCWGLFLLTLGLFQKIVVADHCFAPAADAVFGAGRPVPTADAWLGTLAFAGQIFCDFAGYSTCAIGIALCLGFHLPDNFHRPYAALGFGDFWRRWHITLSTWLRDYCYIPLGGSRRGALRTFANLVTVMGLGGLWHGAAWTFVIWGLLHGAFLVAEHGLRRACGDAAWTRHAATRRSGIAATFVLVLIAWVPFRADSFATTMLTWTTMAGAGPEVPYALAGHHVATVLAAAFVLLASHAWLRDRRSEDVIARWPWPAVGAVWGFMLIALCWAQGGGDAFIYFQF